MILGMQVHQEDTECHIRKKYPQPPYLKSYSSLFDVLCLVNNFRVRVSVCSVIYNNYTPLPLYLKNYPSQFISLVQSITFQLFEIFHAKCRLLIPCSMSPYFQSNPPLIIFLECAGCNFSTEKIYHSNLVCLFILRWLSVGT